jgi:hypothetical protein
MDNCGGHNKNNIVFQLAHFLVEIGFFCTVEFTFYLRGHMKNARDRNFNQMKLKYPMQGMFTWYHALETLNIKDNVTMVDAIELMFKDYGALLDNFYVSFKAGTIQKNHISRVEDTYPTLSVQCALYTDDHYVLQPIVKKGLVFGAERSSALRAFCLKHYGHQTFVRSSKLRFIKSPGILSQGSSGMRLILRPVMRSSHLSRMTQPRKGR